MDAYSEYYQQLQVINEMLENTPEGPEKDELVSLKQNIEELLSLAEQTLSVTDPGKESLVNTVCQDNHESNSSENQKLTPSVTNSKESQRQDNHKSNFSGNQKLDDEYALFMAEMNKEGAVELANKNESNGQLLEGTSTSTSNVNFKEIEGKKFRAPHKHQWGQLAYHNAMVCSVPQDIPNINELEVKVLYLNPTHTEMLPCPYFFDLEKDCHFSEEQCRFSHGELVPYINLQKYIEPKFESLGIGSEVLAKQSDDLWYRGKIAHISKHKCLVKFDTKNTRSEDYEEVVFKHILPLEQSEMGSEDDDSSESDVEAEINEDDFWKEKKHQEKLIHKSLMVTPDTVPLGEWEKYTKGIGSKLMQKMGYIVGTGLGKDGGGIVKPVTTVILPQGKSLDFCMNLKEESKDPHLFHAQNSSISTRKRYKRPKRKAAKRAHQQIKLEQMELDEYVSWYFDRSEFAVEEKEAYLMREKLKVAVIKEINVANFMIEERIKLTREFAEKLKDSIRRLEGNNIEPKDLYKKLSHRETDLKRLNIFGLLVQNELDRRKNNKQMAVF